MTTCNLRVINELIIYVFLIGVSRKGFTHDLQKGSVLTHATNLLEEPALELYLQCHRTVLDSGKTPSDNCSKVIIKTAFYERQLCENEQFKSVL